MRNSEHKRKREPGALAALLGTLVCFLILLLLLSLLVKKGSVSDSLLKLLLPLCCLLSGTVGALLTAGSRDRGILMQLLPGLVPFAALLLLGLLRNGGNTESLLFWNASAFLLPPLAGLIPPGRKKHRKVR